MPESNAPLEKSARTLTDIERDMQFLLDYGGEDPEFSQAADAQLALLIKEEGRKVDGYIAVDRWLEAVEQTRREAGERLIAAANAAREHRQWLRDRLLQTMKQFGRDAITSELGYTVKIAKNGGVLPVMIAPGTDPESLPEPFVKTKKEINREAVRRALEEGVELPFASIGERGERLSVSLPSVPRKPIVGQIDPRELPQ